jgi:serine/threonine protein kinase
MLGMDGHMRAAGRPELFRGWRVVDQLPTKGAEADIYLVSTNSAQYGQDLCVLKLYRHRLEPKLEILNKITEISRQNSRCFVIFLETGFDEQTGRWYELQEYIPLGSLKDIPPETKNNPAFVEKLAAELSEAIHSLHENGIIHCDMKPANVLVRSLDPLDLILTDFGISSLLASDMSQKMTALKGTPMYWAPEAFSRVIGRPCDWWGLGMIALELLTGEHPFEGLSDSQIIHKLTLGNAEIPDSLDPGMAMLVKGLLTKDDVRRWGYDEVRRWLSGERDIPVHYENTPAFYAQTGSRNPFRFEGKDYHTAEELALEWIANEKPWFSGQNYLFYLRQWYESNLSFDEAMEIGNMINSMDPVMALFRFVHGSAKLPFSLLGKTVDANNLRLFLYRVIRRECSRAEDKIVEMLGDGELLSYYDEYVSISGKPDQLFRQILELMRKKPIAEQWSYFDAVENPDAYIWPEDSKHAATGERVETLSLAGAVPIKRESFEELVKAYVLPSAVLSMLRFSSTFAAGMEQIEFWRAQGLLIPREQEDISSEYENMNHEEYVRAARIRCLGQTPQLLERLDFLSGELNKFYGTHAMTSLLRTIERIDQMKNRKIDARDMLFIIKTADLLERRRTIESSRLKQYAASISLAGLIFWLARFLFGGSSGRFIMIPLILFLVGGGVYYTFLVRGTSGDFREEQSDPVAAIGFFSIIVVIRFFDYLVSIAPDIIAFHVGGLYGFALCHIYRSFVLLRNESGIIDLCGSYLFPDARPNG